jgi:hypothetical protein
MARPGSAPARPAGPIDTKQVDPDLLPYLADRKSQLKQFTQIVHTYLPEFDVPPIICILHGKDRQSHEKFIECLKYPHWEKSGFADKSRAGLECKQIALPRITFEDYEDFKECMLEGIRPEATAEYTQEYTIIAKAFNRFQDKPYLLHTYVQSNEWQQTDGQILDYFIRFWQDWPCRKKGSILIACLIVKYMEPAPKKGVLGTFFSRFKPAPDINREIRERLLAAQKQYTELPIFIFDELGDIDFRMATNWSQMKTIKSVCGAYDFLPYLRRLYDQKDKLYMETFALEIKKELKRILDT